MPSLGERGISPKDVLQKARAVKNDEFYTRYEDVEQELSMYNRSVWKNKVVFCNCDAAIESDGRRASAFALYFLENFKELELKKLICTHYVGKIDVFNQESTGCMFIKDGCKEFYDYPEDYTGSFDHPLSLKILKEEADIVCTNPPFSRARDFWKMVIESGKKFLIISNITNVKNDSYIPYFQSKKVWAGYNEVDWFFTPKKELTRAAGYWFTNIKVKNRPKYKQLKIIPLKQISEKYKKYDDDNVLLVDNCYIPCDYKKVFAVSVRPILNGLLEKGYQIVQEKQYRPFIGSREVFARVLVKKV